MKIHAIKLNGRYVNDDTKLVSYPVGDRLYKMYSMNTIQILTDEGKLTYVVYPEFFTNYRSGGLLVDIFIDQIGDIWSQLAYLIHDINYTPCLALKMEHPLSRKTSDILLREMLRFGGMGSVKRNIVYNSVRVFGRKAYENDDELTETNSKLFDFKWTA